MTKRVWQITNNNMGLVYQSSDLMHALLLAFNEEGRMDSDRITARYTTVDDLKQRFDKVVEAYMGRGTESLPFNKGMVKLVARNVARDQAVCTNYKVGIYQGLLDELEELYNLFDAFNLQTIIEA